MSGEESPLPDWAGQASSFGPGAEYRLSIIASRDLPHLMAEITRVSALVHMELDFAAEDLPSPGAPAVAPANSTLRGQAEALLRLARLYHQHASLGSEAADILERMN